MAAELLSSSRAATTLHQLPGWAADMAEEEEGDIRHRPAEALATLVEAIHRLNSRHIQDQDIRLKATTITNPMPDTGRPLPSGSTSILRTRLRPRHSHPTRAEEADRRPIPHNQEAILQRRATISSSRRLRMLHQVAEECRMAVEAVDNSAVDKLGVVGDIHRHSSNNTSSNSRRRATILPIPNRPRPQRWPLPLFAQIQTSMRSTRPNCFARP